MNGNEVLRIVDAIHRDKNIDKDIVFDGIEQSIISAARKYFGEEAEIVVHLDRENGEPSVVVEGEALNANEIGELLGRIAAQTAKQVMIQKIREAERDALYEEYSDLKSQLVTGTITRMDGGTGTVNLGKVEGILPRGEQIPGETHRVNERVRCVVMEVRKAGSRVKIILSRNHPDLVRRLFEIEIPEVAEHVIEVRSIAREAGYRSKVAVSCYDNKVDAVGACVGVRGSRIRTIVDELAGERIDIVRWNDSLQVLVPNSLQPAEVDDVILCPMLGKVIVLVQEDQLSLAIGKKGQNVRLASKLVGWDISVMTQERLDEQIDRSVAAFAQVPGVTDELAEDLIAQGFFTFDDLSVIEPDQLAELGGLTPEQVTAIIEYADVESERQYHDERRARQAERLRASLEAVSEKAAASDEAAPAPPETPAATTEAKPEAEVAETTGEESTGEEIAPTEAAEAVVEAVSAEEPATTGEAETETEQVPADETAVESVTAPETPAPAATAVEEELAAESTETEEEATATAEVDETKVGAEAEASDESDETVPVSVAAESSQVESATEPVPEEEAGEPERETTAAEAGGNGAPASDEEEETVPRRTEASATED